VQVKIGGAMLRMFAVLSLVSVWSCTHSPTEVTPLPDVIPPTPLIDAELRSSSEDDGGLRTLTIRYTPMPVQVFGGDESRTLKVTKAFDLPERYRVLQVCSFIGLVPGDIVEADVRLSAGGEFYSRSEHHAIQNAYDAEKCLNVFAVTDRIRASIFCRVTGLNSEGRLSALVHFGIRLRVQRERLQIHRP